jgi:hypothetical protein
MDKFIHTPSNIPVQLINAIQELLEGEPDIIRRQMAIEWLIVGHAARTGRAHFVIDAIGRHAKQLLADHEQELRPAAVEA